MKYIQLLLIAMIFSNCDLTREIDIDLPQYDTQPVVECYLEPGKPFRLLLTRSYGFFAPLGLDSNFIEETLFQGATVKISYNGQTVNLANQFAFDPSPFKLYNYSSNVVVPQGDNIEYQLEIILEDGTNIIGRTRMIPRVPIDSVVVQFNPANQGFARTLLYATDPDTLGNNYRRMLHMAPTLDSLADQDFITNDRFNTTRKILFGQGYDNEIGDTVINTLFHIDQQYYDYYESVQLAIAGSFNPFAQPSPIKSNVSGTANPMGIFTVYRLERDTVIIER
jgi:Domain of unknown function (DUF4249)